MAITVPDDIPHRMNQFQPEVQPDIIKGDD